MGRCVSGLQINKYTELHIGRSDKQPYNSTSAIHFKSHIYSVTLKSEVIYFDLLLFNPSYVRCYTVWDTRNIFK
jgi:hypothetical protein